VIDIFAKKKSTKYICMQYTKGFMMTGRFSLEQKELFAILSAMQPIVSKRTTLETTAAILFEVGHKELILKSTDLEISLQFSCPLQEGGSEEKQLFLVPGKRIFDLVKELEGTIECTLRNNQLSLTAGTVDLGLNIKDAETFPAFPERIENLMHLESAFLLELLDKVAFLIPQNNANPALNGLYLEINNNGLSMTTTDGHCLAQVKTNKYNLSQNYNWLLPRRAVFEIKKIVENTNHANVFLGICGNQLVFSSESFNFFTKLLADQFPQYKVILEKKDFIPAVVERNSFVKSLRRSSCLLSGQFLATQFAFDEKLLHISMENKEVGTLKENVPLNEFKGARLDIRFYAPYLLNGLQAFSDDQVTLFLKNSMKPVIFEAEKPNYQVTYLVMPISPTMQ
jgi:DNA polymerase-3 subunit beta